MNAKVVKRLKHIAMNACPANKSYHRFHQELKKHWKNLTKKEKGELKND